jgi:tetratricopeptide (TPR) repeat protein
MAPEQLTGQSLDMRSDVYSMGVVLFEMLSGRAPFHAKEIVQLGLAILTKPAPLLIHVDRSIPAGLSEIVGRALEKEPSRRFQSAKELHDALLSGAHPVEFVARSTAGPAPTLDRSEESTLPGQDITKWEAQQTRSAPRGVVIAVLPLTTPPNDPECEYMAAGIAEVLISNIGGIPDVTVISRYATLEYRDAPRDLQKIARNLGISHMVEGSLQREHDRLRVVVNVINAGSNTVGWSRRFDGSVSNVFALQSEVTEAVLSALQIITGDSGKQLPARLPTSDPDAFADYAQARALSERPDIPGNLDRAEEFFLAAIRKDSRFTLAHAGLGQLYWTKFRHRKESAWTAKAMECLMEALRIDPKQPFVREVLATIYRGTGRLAAAAEELRQTLSLQPNNDEAHCLLAQVLAESGNVDAAISEMNEAIGLRPHYALHHMRLGRICYSAGRYPGAIAAFTKATELQPDNAWPFQMLGTAYHSSGDAGRALENYQKSVFLLPTAPAQTNIGMIYYSQNRFAEALAAYENAVKLSPNNPVHHRNAGDALLRMGKAEWAHESYLRAVQLTEELLKVNPNNAEFLSRLAVYYAKLGRFEEAQRCAAQALELNPADVSVIYRKAVVHARAGQPEPALQCLKQALDKGYSRALVLDDDDFAELRDSTEFTALVRK